MTNTEDATRALCGEHGKSLTYVNRKGITCDDATEPCHILWAELQPEVGEAIDVRDGGAIYVVEVQA